MSSLLITGARGQVGSAVARQARARGFDVWSPDRTELNLLDPDALAAAVASRQWAVIINCAAYTAVDRAESEPALAEAINAFAPGIMAATAERQNIPIVHVSTDYVFDGTKASPYLEDDPVNPLCVYGSTKARGEAAVRIASSRHAIIRTAWVLSAGGSNFLNTMLRLGVERDQLGVVNDQVGCPSNAEDIAAALLTVACELDGRSGTWHFVNAGEANWHQLATHIFSAAAKRGYPTPQLVPITTSEYQTPAHRPANSRLDTTRIADDFGIEPRPWRAAVDSILNVRLDRN